MIQYEDWRINQAEHPPLWASNITELVTTEQIARLRISLEGIEPAIWRQIEVPLTATLKALHDVTQAAFGCEGYHLHLFEVGEVRYGVPDPEWNSIDPIRSEKSMRLATLIELGIRRFGYTYDFGDD